MLSVDREDNRNRNRATRSTSCETNFRIILKILIGNNCSKYNAQCKCKLMVDNNTLIIHVISVNVTLTRLQSVYSPMGIQKCYYSSTKVAYPLVHAIRDHEQRLCRCRCRCRDKGTGIDSLVSTSSGARCHATEI